MRKSPYRSSKCPAIILLFLATYLKMNQFIIADDDQEIYISVGKSLVHLRPILFLFANKPAREKGEKNVFGKN